MKIKLKQPVTHNGEDLNVDSIVEIDAKDAKRLIVKGHAEAVDGEIAESSEDAAELEKANAKIVELQGELESRQSDLDEANKLKGELADKLKESETALAAKEALETTIDELKEEIETLKANAPTEGDAKTEDEKEDSANAKTPAKGAAKSTPKKETK